MVDADPLIAPDSPATDLRHRRPATGRRVVATLLWCLMSWFAAQALLAETLRRDLPDGGVATLVDSQELYLAAAPLKGEGLLAFTRRLTGDGRWADTVSAVNNRPRRLMSDRRYRVPFQMLKPALQVQVMQALWPGQQRSARGWTLTVPAELTQVSLWDIAQWLTGDGKNFYKIETSITGNRDHDLRPGQVLRVPTDLLLPAFRAALPAVSLDSEPPPRVATVPPPSSRTPSSQVPSNQVPPRTTPQSPPPVIGPSPDPRLSFESDASGPYAVYRLKKGEALYSAVVVRFVGAVRANEVNQIAQELAQLNRIADVTDMPVGQRVRIPFDLLLPEFLPADNPRRLEYEADRAASAQYSNTVRASSLEGITVILDAGHGGEDPGTNHQGTWESVYVYDVMVRVKHLLEQTTAANVVPTTRDEGRGFEIVKQDQLGRSRRHRVLTNPPYAIRDTRVSTHLRWYLANSKHRRAMKKSKDSAKTLFISLHADSLHQSLRGAMAYVPSTSLTKGTFGKTGAVYTSRKEVKERPRVSFSWKQRTRSEGLSRQLAEKILGSFRRHNLAVHREKPIRDRIIRCRRCRPFVPAVVRYNEVPTKLLLEICNMNNPRDRALLTTAAYRQKVAAAIVDGILDYYGQPSLGPRSRVAAAP